MKRFVASLLIIAFVSAQLLADIAADGSLIFNGDSKQVTITSFSATQVMTNDPYITRSYIINPSTWSSICISSTSVISTSLVPFVPPNTVFSMDGPSIPWWGPLWAEVCNLLGGGQPVAQTISVLRTK